MYKFVCIVCCVFLSAAARYSSFPPVPVQACKTPAEECNYYNEQISPFLISLPWAAYFFTFLFLGLPTVVLEHGWRGRGVLELSLVFIYCLGFLIWCSMHSPSRVIGFAVSVHGAVQGLSCTPIGPYFIGNKAWWSIRHLVSAAILVVALFKGPPVSIISWEGSPPPYCALQAHLIGCLAPEMARIVLEAGRVIFSA